MPFRIGPTELIIILVIIMLVFGVGRLPEVGRSIGKGLRELRKARSGINELTSSLDLTVDIDEAASQAEAKKDATKDPGA